MIDINLVNKSYKTSLFKKKVHAVRGVSFSIVEGEVYGLIGPNGAGKSTIIKMLLGLLSPDSGTVCLRNRPGSLSSARSEIGYLPENPYLYDYLSLNELLAFCGSVSGLDIENTEFRSNYLTERLGLSSHKKRPLRTFSKGMLQRAGICFALLHDPSIVIFDEPMSGLDPIGRKMVFDLVMELKQQGKTIFFCSHILNDVERLCDRIGLLCKGKLVEEFSKGEGALSSGKMIYLSTDMLSQEQQKYLFEFGCSFSVEAERGLLIIPNNSLFDIATYLNDQKISIHGSRESLVSLEHLFMQKVSEAGE